MIDNNHNGKEHSMAERPLTINFYAGSTVVRWSGRVRSGSQATNIDGILSMAKVNVINLHMSARSESAVCIVHVAGLGFDLQISPVSIVDARQIQAACLALMTGQDPAESVMLVRELTE